MALPFIDTFTQNTGADQALATYNASWVVDSGGWSVSDATDDVQATTGGIENVAYWSGDTPDADQAVDFTVSSVTAGVYPGVIARRASAGNYYTLYIGSGEYYVSRYDGGAETVLVGPVAVTTAAGDVFRLEVTGTGATVTLKAFRAPAASPTVFSQLGSNISDSSASRKTAAGRGGLICYSASGSARMTAFQLDNITAGGGGGGGGAVIINAMGL